MNLRRSALVSLLNLSVTVAVFSIFAATALAIPAPLSVKPNSVSSPLRSVGVAQGGRSDEEFSLLGVQAAATSEGEKLTLNYGDRFGKVSKGEPGYFQVALDRGGQRVVIDLSQVTRTGIEPSQLKKILSKSKYVASSDMTMDPHDRSTNITLMLKEPVVLTVATESGSRAKIVLNLQPALP